MALNSRRTWKEQQEQMGLPSFVTAASTGQRPHHGACFQRPDKPTGLSPNLLHKKPLQGNAAKVPSHLSSRLKCHKKANELPKPQILDGGAHRWQTHPFRKEFSIIIQTDLVKTGLWTICMSHLSVTESWMLWNYPHYYGNSHTLGKSFKMENTNLPGTL